MFKVSGRPVDRAAAEVDPTMNSSSLSLSIAQLSTGMQQGQLEMAINVRVMRKANDIQAQAVQELLKSIGIGQQLDITA